jgi:hypothetical protein
LDKKPTHSLVPQPEMGVRYLADYMAGSERKKRSILVSAKYRPLARLMQHKEAKATISNAFAKGQINKDFLRDRADYVRKKMATDDFDALTNEANAGYLARFAEVVGDLDLPGVEFHPGKTYSVPKAGGLKVIFGSNLSLRRMAKGNKLKVGALMLRYAKDKALPPLAAEYQSAMILGFLQQTVVEEGAELDTGLCITLDCHTGLAQPAPSKAVTMFKNTLAACATIADAWPNTPMPPNAILK